MTAGENEMKFLVKKYGRWNEDCNWQCEEEKEMTVTEEQFNNFKEFAGYTYNKRYNEYYVISTDKLKMTLVRHI